MVAADLLIGLSVFLFGMVLLERNIEALFSRPMKRWLQRSTGNPVSSVLAGTAITAFVQSSSIVSLIVLAFASAGIMPLYNAIGVLLGANLGTTFTGWVVTTLGFKLNLAAVALPAIGIGAFVQVLGDRRVQIQASGALIFGFGLLLYGLSLMKDAVGNLSELLDLEQLRNLSAVSYLLLGVALTAVIQSSSASMIIALTALHGGIIDLPGAAALIIGADLGTTSTTILGSLKGSSIKRQLALAHLLFNLAVNLLAFVVLLPMLPVLLDWFKLTDPLYSLVAFHSTFNAMGIFIFMPALRPYANWIGKRFVKGTQVLALDDVPVEVPEAAIGACQNHTLTMLTSALSINVRNLQIAVPTAQPGAAAEKISVLKNGESQSFERSYENLKQSEGDLLNYVSLLQKQTLEAEQSTTISELLNCARETVYSVKSLKDIRPNLTELRHALSPTLLSFSTKYQSELKPFYQNLSELLASPHSVSYVNERLAQLNEDNERLYQELHYAIRSDSGFTEIEPEQLSTLLNINNEIRHSGRSLLKALEHWYGLLDSELLIQNTV